MPVGGAVRRRHLLRRRRRARRAARLPPVGADAAGGGQHLDRDHAAAGHGGAAAAAARADRRPPAVRLLRRPTSAEAERLLAPMKDAGHDRCSGFVGPIRTDEMDSIHMDPVDPMPAWEKGMLLTELTEEAVDALLAVAGPQVEIPLIMVEIRLMGGALARPAKVPNAVPAASGAFSVLRDRPRRPGAGRGRAGRRQGRARRAARRGRRPSTMINFLGDVVRARRRWPRPTRRRATSGCARSRRPSTRPASSPSATRSDVPRPTPRTPDPGPRRRRVSPDQVT